MFTLKKLLPYTMAAILLSATASLPAMAAFEYDEPRTENERIELIDRLIVENQWRRSSTLPKRLNTIPKMFN